MSDNPYAPPSAELGTPGSYVTQGGQGDLDIGKALSDAWTHTWANFPLWLGAGIAWTLLFILATATVIGIVAIPALVWGGTLLMLRMHDGGARFGDIVVGFSVFGKALSAFTVIMLAFIGMSMVASSIQLAGSVTENGTLMAVGYLVSLAFNLLILPPFYLAFFFAVDRGASGVEALQLAWSETRACHWKLVMLALLAYPLMIAGLLCFLIGVIPATMIWYLAFVSAYRQITGPPGAA